MYFSTTLLLSLAATALAAPLALPQDDSATAAASGSRKNVYLTTCNSDGLLGLTSSSSSQALYYNGQATSRNSPSDVGTVAEPARAWDGASRRVRLSGKQFTSSIADGADAIAKSEIAGSAKFGDEDMICFRDGSTTFSFSSGLLGLSSTVCKADYWCASIAIDN